MTNRTGLATAAAVLALTGGTVLAAPPAGAATTDFGPAEIRTGMYAGPDDLCLEVADWRTDDGAPVRIWTCTGGANQKWTRTADGWINLNSGKCLEIPAFSTTPGTQADQWTCNGGGNQQWSDPPVSHAGTPPPHRQRRQRAQPGRRRRCDDRRHPGHPVGLPRRGQPVLALQPGEGPVRLSR